MEERSLLDWAREYTAKGYQVIPIQEGGKKPLVKWQGYQKEKVSEDLLNAWFKGCLCNIAIVTGSISGITVIDWDFRHGSGALYRSGDFERYATVNTGSGGVHCYCRYNVNDVRTMAGVVQGVDIRSEGGYVVAPPSKTTGPYTFVTGSIPEIQDLPKVEDIPGLRRLLNKETIETKHLPRKIPTAGSLMHRFPLQFVSATEGNRNQTAARMAGLLCRECASMESVRMGLQFWNNVYCKPPLDNDELDSVIESIWKKHNGIK